jgi:hypothetical protein
VRWETNQVSEKFVVSKQRSGHFFAFSGGVDSAATLRRHASESLGSRNLHAAAAVIVHGFDIPVSEIRGFRGACRHDVDADVVDGSEDAPHLAGPLRQRWKGENGHPEANYNSAGKSRV